MAERARSRKKERKLEEFRSFLNEEKEENKEVMERRNKTQNCFVCVKNSSEKPSNQVAIEN